MPRDDFAKDYVQVDERIRHFYERYPEGRIQTDIVEMTEARITMLARVFRAPDDPVPTTGHSWLGIPGSTPYTKGSEIENAETSAVGRALALMGFDTHKGLASAEEVRNKRQDATPATRPAQRGSQAPTVDASAGLGSRDFFTAAEGAGIDRKRISAVAKDLFGQWQVNALTNEQRAHLLEELTAPIAAVKPDDGPDLLWEGTAK